MLKLLLLFSCIVLTVGAAFSQNIPDSSKVLDEVIIRAWEDERSLRNTPSSLIHISNSDLERGPTNSVLPAINAMPGIRMEERSPGSYRLNIRGSSLRSPFGVRNVKIYYRGIPFTDPGGQSFFNQLGFYNFNSITIIKGPGSSLYGTGTGGVLLLNDGAQPEGTRINYSAGSFNQHQLHAGLHLNNEKQDHGLQVQRQTAQGYRHHAEMRRELVNYDAAFSFSERQKLALVLLYGDLFYETPGALTRDEYLANPRSARPRAFTVAGAEEKKAAIYQKMWLAGINHHFKISGHWNNLSTLYYSSTRLTNPTIRNYEQSRLPHYGGRTVFTYKHQSARRNLQWHSGIEYQRASSLIKVYDNILGRAGTLRSEDEVENRQYFLFTQLSLEWNNWLVTGGMSLNKMKLQFKRVSEPATGQQERNYNNELAPRVAILRKINSNVSVYAGISKGFSPPTVGELSPSGGQLNPTLRPEQGFNLETGSRGSLLENRLSFDISLFYFRLRNTIVQRRDVTGADHFINAGSTNQRGIESALEYRLPMTGNFVEQLRIFASHSYHRFNYRDFRQFENDYSGNQLPSVAPHTIGAALDLQSQKNFYLNLSYFYSDAIALNDANTAYANAYHLLGGRLGYRKKLGGLAFELFTGVENLFNTTYSLGNDINAFGGRYYNAAAGTSFYAGLSLMHRGKK